MSERDLIERLRGPVLSSASRLIAGAFRRDGEYLDTNKRPSFSIPANVEADDDLVVVRALKEAAATIARLSEALAEAEKKGAEGEGALAKAIFQADYPTDKWERFARGDVVDERYRLLARAALAHIFPPRDLSQGGQP